MGVCAVYGCASNTRNRITKVIKLFRFPRDIKLQRQWRAACKREDVFNVKHARICSLHFKKSDYKNAGKENTLLNSPKKIRVIHSWAVPTLHLPRSNEESGM